ncbi:MAG: hypothetical protein V1835_06735 [Candidatus Micrarchaeota archaeon]
MPVEPQKLEPQKILLIEGIHPNEIKLAAHLKAELMSRGHTVRIIQVKYKDTLHYHSENGEGKRHISHFEGWRYMHEIGLEHPEWHAVAIHSTPSNINDALHFRVEKEKVNGGKTDNIAGHLLFNFGALDPEPAYIQDGQLLRGTLLRLALEVPAIYYNKPYRPINEGKFDFRGMKNGLAGIRQRYGTAVDHEKTFRQTPRNKLVKEVADRMEKMLSDAVSVNSGLQKTLKPLPLSEIVRMGQNEKYSEKGPEGFRKVFYWARKLAGGK